MSFRQFCTAAIKKFHEELAQKQNYPSVVSNQWLESSKVSYQEPIFLPPQNPILRSASKS
jgi:hypothetical protein